MSKRLIVILALVFVACFTVAANAEVQNLKVSGDLSTTAFSRNNLDLGNAWSGQKIYLTGILGIARVRLDANLTDNVDAVIQMMNERVWSTLNESGSYAEKNQEAFRLSLAFVALKDFLKDSTGVPLTLVIGRQPIRLGSGLLVGDPDTNQMEIGPLTDWGIPWGATGIQDLGAKKAFDGAIAVLDYSPLVVNVALVKGYQEMVYDKFSSINVFGINAIYKLGENSKDTVLEGTYLVQQVGENAGFSGKDNVNNYGIRVTSAPFKNISVEGEYVYQTAKKYGIYDANNSGLIHNDASTQGSDALRLVANMGFPDTKWTPSLGIDYTRLSKYWNVMHEDMTPADIMNVLFPNQNVECIGITATAKPREDMLLKLRYANAVMAKKADGAWTFYSAGMFDGSPFVGYDMTGKKQLGYELDMSATYDYTADVQFGLNLGTFKPGKAFDSKRKAANELLGSMKVTF